MVDWKAIFSEISSEIYHKIKPILNTKKAKEIVGKGAGGDLTRYIDALAEECAIMVLKKNNISCILVSEESGTKKIGDNPKNYVVLDPIDGTNNALRRLPFFCTSIALSTGPNLNNVELGFVMNLSNKETFFAEKNHGAYRGKTCLKPSLITNVTNAIISVELSLPHNQQHLKRLTPLLLNLPRVRHLGATALEICYVASGALEAFIDLRNIARSVDLAAAYIIIKEAGGLMVTPDGNEIDLSINPAERIPLIAAANEAICKDVLRLIM